MRWLWREHDDWEWHQVFCFLPHRLTKDRRQVVWLERVWRRCIDTPPYPNFPSYEYSLDEPE